jgi:hypothetical protein
MRADCLFGADQTPSRALTAASPLCHPGPTQGECLSCGARVAVVPGEFPWLVDEADDTAANDHDRVLPIVAGTERHSARC